MRPRRVPSAVTEGASSVEGRENLQMRDSSLLQAVSVVCKGVRKEIGLCSKRAQNENCLWRGLDARIFTQSMKKRENSEWYHIPQTYLKSDWRNHGAWGDEGWPRTPRGSTFTAVRAKSTRATIVFVPFLTNKCLPHRMTVGLTEECMSVEDLQKIIMNHLEKGNRCLQITTPTPSCGSQAAVLTNDSESQATVSTTSCGNQASVTLQECGLQVTVGSSSSGSQATVGTSSCGCQTKTNCSSTGTQASPQTSEVECQATPAKHDVACQTDIVNTSDAEVSATGHTLVTCVQAQNSGTITPEESESESQLSDDCHNDEIQTLHTNNHLSVSPLSPVVEMEDDVEEFDDFQAGYSARLKVMAEELNNRYSQRNELSLADELAGARQDISIKNDNSLSRVGNTEDKNQEEEYMNHKPDRNDVKMMDSIPLR